MGDQAAYEAPHLVLSSIRVDEGSTPEVRHLETSVGEAEN